MDQPSPQDTRTVKRIMLGSFAVGLVLFAGVLVYLLTAGGMRPLLPGLAGGGGTGGGGGATLSAALVAAAIVLPIGAGVLGAFIKPRGESGSGKDAAFAALMIRASVIEGTGLAACFIAMLTGELSALVGAVIAAGLIVHLAMRV